MTISFWTTGRDVLQAQMRHLARGLTRRHLVAVVAGMLLGGASMLAFNVWLGFQIEGQAQREIATAARRALSLAETRIGTALAVANQIAGSNQGSCTSGLMQSLRRSAWGAAPVKQVGVLTADGRILCSEPEAPEPVDDVVSSHVLVAIPGATLHVLRLADGQSVLRVRRKSGSYESYAIVPSSLLLPEGEWMGVPSAPMPRSSMRTDSRSARAGCGRHRRIHSAPRPSPAFTDCASS
jgi:hypothetical protein